MQFAARVERNSFRSTSKGLNSTTIVAGNRPSPQWQFSRRRGVLRQVIRLAGVLARREMPQFSAQNAANKFAG